VFYYIVFSKGGSVYDVRAGPIREGELSPASTTGGEEEGKGGGE
jgi:hypothetical protein